MMRISETVKHLIIINIVFWVGTLTVGQYGSTFDNLFAMHFPKNDMFKPWQVITHMFMHGSYVDYGSGPSIFPLHILFNMLGLWMFGTPLEQMWGRNKFLFFYISAGLGATLLPLAIDYYNFYSITAPLVDQGLDTDTLIAALNEGKYNERWVEIIGEDNWRTLLQIFLGKSLGASGCIMGILVAFGMMFPNSELMLLFLPIPIKAKYFIPLLLGYEIIAGFFGGTSMFGFSIGHFAHIGGALIGLLIMLYWRKKGFRYR
ncbi:rhomboid family intramembrane serine protease [Seonamhaeicola marinus]|uniref:Rhomboid family intramembrane serine protease n=1 Tax=Seonamhaeicola marinus TaxID=1912246 RepID=A0A5D0INC5_9FLAO|nr:rhomboid family intramembrane serine protease [Seonamhaeicola marinus]TYA84370.1 rhomboid family intramembrane serine protease [Seonamhaeicola marinus]